MIAARRLLAVPVVRAVIAATAVALLASACVGSAPPDETTGGVEEAGVDWSAVASAPEGGGMPALVAAAQAEGTLTTIALPPAWIDYREIVSTFEEKYGITVEAAEPRAPGPDGGDVRQQLGAGEGAPDVLDLEPSSAMADDDLLAPYRVETFDTIPEEHKDAEGRWVNGYRGFVSIGCNASIVADCPTTVAALADPRYAGQVAINGDPTQAASALASVWAAALASGGSLDDIEPGIAFWGELAASGNLLGIDPTPATIQSGRTPIVLDWDHINVAATEENLAAFDWQVAVPGDGLFARYRAQAINRDAPHPAAARLWLEFLYSDEGQNLWLAEKARPVRLAEMAAANTANPDLLAALPPVEGEPRHPTEEQTDAAQRTVDEQWADATA